MYTVVLRMRYTAAAGRSGLEGAHSRVEVECQDVCRVLESTVPHKRTTARDSAPQLNLEPMDAPLIDTLSRAIAPVLQRGGFYPKYGVGIAWRSKEYIQPPHT